MTASKTKRQQRAARTRPKGQAPRPAPRKRPRPSAKANERGSQRRGARQPARVLTASRARATSLGIAARVRRVPRGLVAQLTPWSEADQEWLTHATALDEPLTAEGARRAFRPPSLPGALSTLLAGRQATPLDRWLARCALGSFAAGLAFGALIVALI